MVIADEAQWCIWHVSCTKLGTQTFFIHCAADQTKSIFSLVHNIGSSFVVDNSTELKKQKNRKLSGGSNANILDSMIDVYAFQ